MADKWHLDEVVIPINGKKYWLWRAVDSRGDVLDILVQARRDKRAASRFSRKLFKAFGEPRVIVTDKLRSYGAALKELAPGIEHRILSNVSAIVKAGNSLSPMGVVLSACKTVVPHAEHKHRSHLQILLLIYSLNLIRLNQAI